LAEPADNRRDTPLDWGKSKNMYKIKIVSVGKMKKGYWCEAVAHYEKMLRATARIEAIHVKDCSHLQGWERKTQEAALLGQKIAARDRVLALHEKGVLYSSHEFASMLRGVLENPTGQCCFVIGGALGLGQDLLESAHGLVSLGPMTMPHELAQVVLYEQIFRAMTIIGNRAYHY